MKRSSILLSFICILLCTTGCEKFISFEYYFPDEYDNVYCFIPNKRNSWVKDTTICFSREDLRILTLMDWGEGIKRGQITLGGGSVDYLFNNWQIDTVSFFIFSKDIVDSHSWDYIIKNYCVLQRYDFSKEDIIKLKCQIPYPPSAEMEKMHMYPPFR